MQDTHNNTIDLAGGPKKIQKAHIGKFINHYNNNAS